MCRVLERHGYKPKGFIDSSVSMQGEKVLGLSVFDPKDIFSNTDNSPFIIITSGFYSEEISERCLKAGLTMIDDFIVYKELQRFEYCIDVSGSCNLQCISCPRSNFPRQPKAGFMSVQNYEKVLSKILKDDPFVGAVYLYNYGEPLLHPQLSEIIKVTNEMGVHATVSSNLNIRKDFSEVIRARPSWFRVSVSGIGKNYEMTHTGGSWELFLKNMYRLRDWREAYHPDMQVEVYYHIYRHNNQEDFYKIRNLSEELGFTFRFRHAGIHAMENIEDIIDSRPLSKEALKTIDLLAFDVHEALALARTQKEMPCSYERCMWITWDMKIRQCIEWFNPDLYLVSKDFLSVSLDEISKARVGNQFCKKCKEKAIHRYLIVNGDEALIHKRQSVKWSERESV
jgi:MoaA/NifB/PqqE/SkfB family radical SAM enzyme